MARWWANSTSTATSRPPSSRPTGDWWNLPPAWSAHISRANLSNPLPAMKHVVAALIVRDGRVLVCQRTRHQTMPLKWEFPGGKIEDGEQPRDALRRELDEELGIDAQIGDEVVHMRHEYKNGNVVELHFF